ncbi:YtxH domain-containing protein [Priestia endophytica]|uniref:YtxH domain-containing protein n=1 Tax=Priestia endophytica TaxID=135735 RepID=UPI00203D66F4|nr:hypothetical protein [Priestia endophytica]MCM3536445.1 hypothetical protein [Priestia endophytica]
MKKAASFSLGILFGSVTAGTIALLTTPCSSKDMKLRVGDSRDTLKVQLKDIKENALNVKIAIQNVVKESKETFSQLAPEAKASIANFQEDIAPHQRSIQNHLAEIEQNIKGLEDKLGNQQKKETQSS